MADLPLQGRAEQEARDKAGFRAYRVQVDQTGGDRGFRYHHRPGEKLFQVQMKGPQSSTSTIFFLLPSPLIILTCDFGTPKCSASSSTSRSLAFPSTARASTLTL